MGEGGTGRRLLFVCTGNTCRSPMAEVVARRMAGERGMEGLEVRSAGVASPAGSPASRGARLAAREAGLDLSEHRSRPLTPEEASWADLVLCMDEGHRLRVEEMEGEGVLLTHYLPPGHPERGEAVPDPVGGPLDVYRETLELIRASVEGLLARLAEEDEGGGGPGRHESP